MIKYYNAPTILLKSEGFASNLPLVRDNVVREGHGVHIDLKV